MKKINDYRTQGIENLRMIPAIQLEVVPNFEQIDIVAPVGFILKLKWRKNSSRKGGFWEFDSFVPPKPFLPVHINLRHRIQQALNHG